MDARLSIFDSREAASIAVAGFAADALRQEISDRGGASLFVSGGATPRGAFDRLSEASLDWARVTVGLVDERWVPPDHPESNELLVRKHLLRSHAAKAAFLPMWTEAYDHDSAAMDRDVAYRASCQEPTFVLLGMGADGHTASWFPGMSELETVLTPPDGRSVMAVRATASEIPRRLTLTGTVVNRARHAALLIFGKEKREVLEAALTSDPLVYPVRHALDGLGARLRIVWAS